MTRTGLVLANLFHRKTRTWLTLLSVVMAFTLFGLLQAVIVVFSSSGDFVGTTRLITQSRVSFTNSLPMRMVPEMDAIPGVQRVMYQQWFGGVSKKDNSEIFTFAVDPERLHEVYPEFVMPEEHWQAFARGRTGIIVGHMVAEKYGWKAGDRIPLSSNIFPQKNGSKDWEFDVVGVYDGIDEQWRTQTNGIYINHAYFAEASQFGGGLAGMFAIRIENPEMAEAIARDIDQRFENSADETRTMSEKDFTVNFFKQLGDIGLMVRWILFAVFFTLLLVVGNTMAQSVRERVPQFAVLKTLGFTDDAVLGFVLAETFALCAIGGVLGMAIAWVLSRGIANAAGGFLPPILVNAQVWGTGALAILLLSLAVGLLPALRARRLRIVDALAGR
jgi:putative ABC transport system permease protein